MNGRLKIIGETDNTGGVRRRSARSGMRLPSRFNVEGAMWCAESARRRVFGQLVEVKTPLGFLRQLRFAFSVKIFLSGGGK
jgi:hypothetical protein